jgi:Rod binding domain-containing protein
MRAMAAMMAAQAGASDQARTDPRLKPAAHQFEACMMKEFLEPLQRDALFDDGKDSAGSEGSNNALMSFGSEALARAISDRGGFGIATKIIGQLEGKPAGKAAGDENSLRMDRKR